MNPGSHIRYALDFAARHGLHPDFAIYEPGFMRAGAALARAAGVKVPIYRLMFCNLIAVGFPPKPYALAAYHALLEEEAPGAPWMIAGVSADLRPLFAETIARGGHIRVGLEDAPLGTNASNLELVEEAVRMVREHGAEPATPPKCGRRWLHPPEPPRSRWTRFQAKPAPDLIWGGGRLARDMAATRIAARMPG